MVNAVGIRSTIPAEKFTGHALIFSETLSGFDTLQACRMAKYPRIDWE